MRNFPIGKGSLFLIPNFSVPIISGNPSQAELILTWINS